MIVHLIQKFREIGWSIKIAFLKCILITLDYGFNSIDSWIKDVSIQSKAVRGSIWVGWNGTSKSIESNLLVWVVELKYISNILDGLQVLIPGRVEVMKWALVSWISIGEGKVYGNGQIDLTTSKYILQEGVMLLNFEMIKLEITGSLGKSVACSSLSQGAQGHGGSTQKLMLSWRIWLEEFHFDLILNIILAKIGASNLNLIVIEDSILGPLDLRFEHWSEFAQWDLSVDDEEAKTAIVLQLTNWVEHNDLGVLAGSFLFSSDDDVSRVFSILAGEWLCHRLITACDNLMQGEDIFTDEIVTGKVLWLVIITVVDLDLVLLVLLEVEVHVNFLDEFWV